VGNLSWLPRCSRQLPRDRAESSPLKSIARFAHANFSECHAGAGIGRPFPGNPSSLKDRRHTLRMACHPRRIRFDLISRSHSSAMSLVVRKRVETFTLEALVGTETVRRSGTQRGWGSHLPGAMGRAIDLHCLARLKSPMHPYREPGSNEEPSQSDIIRRVSEDSLALAKSTNAES
jgi:hypothetical protein